MSMPFMLVYLTQVRGIDMTVAGLVLSTVALASFIGNPLGGWLSDHLGPRTVLLSGLLCAGAGAATFAWAAQPAVGFLAAALLGLGNSIAWPAFDALLATVVTPEQRSGAFAVRHATLNAGIAVGAVVATTRPAVGEALDREGCPALVAVTEQDHPTPWLEVM